MAATRVEITDEWLEDGQVKTISTGKTVNLVELLVGENIKAQLYYNKKENCIQMCMKNTELNTDELICELSKEVTKNLIVGLKNLYNQLEE